MTLYSGMSVNTANIHGTITLLNLDFKKTHPFFILRDRGVKYPEMKNMIGIMIISVIKLRIPDKSFFEGSSTIHSEDKIPLRS
jgi:hypothetical protein